MKMNIFIRDDIPYEPCDVLDAFVLTEARKYCLPIKKHFLSPKREQV